MRNEPILLAHEDVRQPRELSCDTGSANPASGVGCGDPTPQEKIHKSKTNPFFYVGRRSERRGIYAPSEKPDIFVEQKKCQVSHPR